VDLSTDPTAFLLASRHCLCERPQQRAPYFKVVGTTGKHLTESPGYSPARDCPSKGHTQRRDIGACVIRRNSLRGWQVSGQFRARNAREAANCEVGSQAVPLKKDLTSGVSEAFHCTLA
jgi:hypothetical protein